ncbi:MAG TPA: questin oxidase family protein, partial [Stellaceae bacterium]|nr:questin oxidase family protein [Stellaceae bacterium]
RPPAGGRLGHDEWRAALGRRDRFAEWSAFFDEELAEAPWRRVLDRWVERLMPGYCAAAMHGVIRVCHAVRGLAQSETPRRLRELADALASWAATYRELPATGHGAGGTLSPRRAIAAVAIVPPARRRQGNIVAALAALDDFPAFAPVSGLIDTGGDIAALLAELTEVFARVYLANARTPLTAVAFIHGVTGSAALGNIAPHIDEGTARKAVRYAWQSGCGLYACFGGGAAMAETVAPCEKDEDALIDLAVRHGDEHVIKFTEACLRRHALAPSPAYFAAVEHIHGMIRPRRDLANPD